jgi:uncharacterized membrane protein
MASPEISLAPRASALPLTVIARAFGLLFGIGASFGLAVWGLLADSAVLPYALNNRLPIFERQQLLIAMFGSGALLALGALALVAVRAGEGLRRLDHVSLRLAPLTLLGFVPFLFRWQLWTERELTFAVLVSILGLTLRASIAASLRVGPLFPGSGASVLLSRIATFIDTRARFLSWALVVLGALGYAIFFSYHTIVNHHNLLSYAFDLGLEENILYNVVHFGPFMKSSPLSGPTGSHFGFHATLFAYVIGLVYVFAQRAETLLVFQSVMIAAAALPLYGFAKRHIGRWAACLVALLYLLYAPVHGSNLYDFHYLPLGVFFLWLSLYLVDAGHNKLAVLAVLLTLSVREDVAADLIIIGLVLVLISKKPGPGVLVAAAGAVYFFAMKMVIMPTFLHGDSSFIHQYQGLLPAGERGYGGVLKTVVANPVFTLTSLLEQEKVIYLAQLAAPLCFFPWRRPLGLVCTIPGFFFTLLATGYLPLVQISFQYTAHWTTFLFVALVMNLARARRAEFPGDREGVIRQRAWLVAIACLTLVTSHQWGALFQQNTVKGGFGRYKFGTSSEEQARYQKLLRLIAMVPPKAKIVSSENIVPHTSNRPDSYTLRQGMFDAEYLLFNIPLTVYGEEVTNVKNSLKSKFGVVAFDAPFVLAKRGHPQDKNEEVLKKLR